MSNLINQEDCITIEIKDPKIISVNDQYMHPVRKTKRGSYVSYFAPSPYLKEVQAFYKDILKREITDEDIKKLRKSIEKKQDGIKFEMIIGMPLKDLLNYDISNLVKAIEDCVVSRTGIDDSRDYYVSAEKRLYENDGHWILKISLSPMKVKGYLDYNN